MAQNITFMGASYSDVPAVTLPKTGGGTAKFTDVTPTTATDADVASGKIYFKADGTQSTGTNAGGITPTGNIDITQAGVTDVTDYATATVPSANLLPWEDHWFTTESGSRKWVTETGYVLNGGSVSAGWVSDNDILETKYNAIPTGTSVTPTESAQTIGGANYMMEGAVTVNAIPSSYVGSGITRRDSTDLSASGATVSVPSGYYASNASKAVSSGTEGTPTATKGTVTNHSVSITPSVTNTAGYISGGTHSGTAVSVSASELVSGNLAITENGSDIDVANYSTVSVNVSGGSSTVAVGTKTATLSASASSIQFTGLSGNPTSFVVTSSADQSTGGTKAVAVAWDGTSFHGMDVTTQAEADTGFSKTYSSGTLTITATTATFEANEYKLVYTYGGSSSDIHTDDVQVGSGATSITFTGLSGRPIYFSCVFKSSFSTSSGYQRVIDVVNDGTNTYGHAFDSSAKAQTSWTSSYSGGSLTITSSGTNNGGYFHQPGYYQLTYAVDDSAPQYETVSKTYRASTSAQSETIQPSSGYDAIEQVSISIPAVSQTNLSADNIKQGTTITISNGSTNLWSVTGTYTGGGGGGESKNTQVVQGTTRTTSSTLTAIGAEMTVSKTGTYDVYWSGVRTTTSGSYTYGTQLYIDGTAYGTQNTTWSNHVQNNHLTNVSLTANQKIRVYGRNSRGSSYYIYAPTLVIVEK